MTLRSKIIPPPAAGLYTKQEICEDLNIPIEAIDRIRKSGLIAPDMVNEGEELYTLETVRLIERQYYNSPMRNYVSPVKPMTTTGKYLREERQRKGFTIWCLIFYLGGAMEIVVATINNLEVLTRRFPNAF